MNTEQMSLISTSASPTVDDQLEGFSLKEQELIRQLVKERLGKKNAIGYESLSEYYVPPEVYFARLKTPAVNIRARSLEFSMSSVRLFEGVQYVLPMLNDKRKRFTIAICAEEELSSIEWAKLKNGKWINRTVTCPEYTQDIYRMMEWNGECRYKAFGRLSNSERGLVLVFELSKAVMFDPLPEEYLDKHTGKMKKRINKYYPDEIRMKLGRSYSDYEAAQRSSNFESLYGYTDTSGSAIPATINEEDAASLSAQEQDRKLDKLMGTIIGKGEDNDG